MQIMINIRFFVIFVLFNISSFEVLANICPDGSYLVRKHPRQSYYKSDGAYVSATSVASYCRNYRDDGPLKLKSMIKAPSLWPHKNEKFKKCQEQSLKNIQSALVDLPAILTNIGELKIYCADTSIFPNNPASSAPEAQIIVLYDLSFLGDLKKIVDHELAHILYDRLSSDEKRDLHQASQWERNRTGAYVTVRTNFSEPDGANDPEEDFANNVEHYIFNTTTFKKNYSSIYFWIDQLLKKSTKMNSIP